MNSHVSKLSLAEDLLARACDDWVSAAEVIDVARRSGARDPDDLRDLSVGLIARLLLSDLMIAGDISGAGHQPWACSKAEAIARIAAEWAAASDPFVMPGEIVWLDVTREGERVGEALRRQETHEQGSGSY